VAREQIRCARRRLRRAAPVTAPVARGERVRPRCERREPAQLTGAVEPVERDEADRVAYEGGVGGEKEGDERRALDHGAIAVPPVQTHVAAVGVEVAGEEAWRVVPPEDDRRA